MEHGLSNSCLHCPETSCLNLKLVKYVWLKKKVIMYDALAIYSSETTSRIQIGNKQTDLKPK